MNYKGDQSYAKKLWKCDDCKNMDSEQHILWCTIFTHLRESKNLDKDLCQYLQKVNKIRAKDELKGLGKEKMDGGSGERKEGCKVKNNFPPCDKFGGKSPK